MEDSCQAADEVCDQYLISMRLKPGGYTSRLSS